MQVKKLLKFSFEICRKTTFLAVVRYFPRVFVRAGTPGPLLGYFNFCPGYFHAQFVLKLLWRLWSADNFKFERKLR